MATNNRGNPRKPSEQLLLNIAKAISKWFDCTELAINLNVEASFVSKCRATNPTHSPDAVALEVLTEWEKQEKASSGQLYKLLDNSTTFEHLARHFKAELLPEETPCGQSSVKLKTSAKFSTDKPDLELLQQLSRRIHTHFDCEKLALHLNIDEDHYYTYKAETLISNDIAWKILQEWYGTEEASGIVLYQALQRYPFEHLAEDLKERLILPGGDQEKCFSSSDSLEDSEEKTGTEEEPPPKKPRRETASDHGPTALQGWRGKVTSDHLFELEKTTAATYWYVRRLHKETVPGRPHAFEEADIERIKKMHSSDSSDYRECLREMINTWCGMSLRHTIGFLYDVLVKEDLGGIAERIFCKS